MKKILKREKAITLIGLIVTIIILLILAGISIAQLTGNGLFEKAKLAKEKQEKAQEKENIIISEYENNIGNLGSITSTDRGFSESTIIKDFNIRVEVKELSVKVFIEEENIEDLNNNSIGYIITFNGEGKKVTNKLPETIYLKPKQKGKISIIAIDKNINAKSSANSCEIDIPDLITEVLDYPIFTTTGMNNIRYKVPGAEDWSYILDLTVDCTAPDALDKEAYDGDESTYHKADSPKCKFYFGGNEIIYSNYVKYLLSPNYSGIILAGDSMRNETSDGYFSNGWFINTYWGVPGCDFRYTLLRSVYCDMYEIKYEPN